ncbi:unnamed protein product, partial [Amoebophrya sp. A25]
GNGGAFGGGYGGGFGGGKGWGKQGGFNAGWGSSEPPKRIGFSNGQSGNQAAPWNAQLEPYVNVTGELCKRVVIYLPNAVKERMMQLEGGELDDVPATSAIPVERMNAEKWAKVVVSIDTLDKDKQDDFFKMVETYVKNKRIK